MKATKLSFNKKIRNLEKSIITLILIVGLIGTGMIVANMFTVEATWEQIVHRSWELNEIGKWGLTISLVSISLLSFYELVEIFIK